MFFEFVLRAHFKLGVVCGVGDLRVLEVGMRKCWQVNEGLVCVVQSTLVELLLMVFPVEKGEIGCERSKKVFKTL